MATTDAAPTLSGMTISKIDASKLGDENRSARSSGPSPKTSRCAATRLDRPRWQSKTPLGFPVVPEVKMT